MLKYDANYFTLGNNDVKISPSGEITSIFGKLHTAFDTKGHKEVDLLGAKGADGKWRYDWVEFHQLFFWSSI